MLKFTEQLKELIYDIEINGGNSLQKVFPPSKLVHKLKEYAISKLRKHPEPLPQNVTYFLEEFKDGFFEEGIRAGFIYLAEIGITDLDEVQRILIKLVERRLEEILNEGDFQSSTIAYANKITLDDALVQSLEDIWNDGGSELTKLYNIAEHRFLISWNYQQNSWQITGLGKFILGLNPVQVITFILTIDLIFSKSDYDTRYVSADTFERIRDSEEKRFHIPENQPYHEKLLNRFGIVKYSRDYMHELAPIGKAVIEDVLSDTNSMIDVLNALLDDESQGIKFKGTDKELEFLQKQLDSRIFDQNSISSLENAISLFRKGSYTDAVRIFFPSIEALANQMLSEAGETPNDYKKYKGLADKLKKLEELKLISPDLAMAIDITTSRNKVLHGQYEPLEQEYSYPICVASIIYLRRMLNEFEKVKTKGGSN